MSKTSEIGKNFWMMRKDLEIKREELLTEYHVVQRSAIARALLSQINYFEMLWKRKQINRYIAKLLCN